MSSEIILKTSQLTKQFGGLVAVNNLSIEVERGSLKSIIGPNGSGKTTFFNLITGALEPTKGKILFENKDITQYQMHEVSQIGISRSYQITNIFPHLSAFENIRLAIQSRGGRKIRYNIFKRAGDIKKFHEKTFEIADIVKLDPIMLYAPASMLPHAEQRKLEMAMALGTNPKLLLLDEPTAGMAMEEIPEVYEAIVNVKKSYGDRLTILVIEHKMGIVMTISEEILVLSSGSIIAKGTPEEIKNDENVLTAYLGGLNGQYT